MMEEVAKKTTKGHSCCACKNSGGMIIDGRRISLHRFPADETVSQVWKSRIKLVMKRFVYTSHSRLCSAHFVGGGGPKKPYVTVPSIFGNCKFKTSTVRYSFKILYFTKDVSQIESSRAV
jgi:hypothetical protein